MTDFEQLLKYTGMLKKKKEAALKVKVEKAQAKEDKQSSLESLIKLAETQIKLEMLNRQSANAQPSQPVAPAPVVSASPASGIEQLNKLRGLYDQGFIDESDFNARKAQLIDQMTGTSAV